MNPTRTIRALLLTASLALCLAPRAEGQSELPKVIPFAWSFKNFSTNPCVPPGTNYTWERYRETFIGIPPDQAAASGFDSLFFDEMYATKVGATGTCFGMS